MMRRNLPCLVAAAVIILVPGCAMMRVDGDAVECSACRAMWIRLFEKSAAPGLYLLDEQKKKSPPCPRCQELSLRFFESGVLLNRCSDCGGKLRPRTANIVR